MTIARALPKLIPPRTTCPLVPPLFPFPLKASSVDRVPGWRSRRLSHVSLVLRKNLVFASDGGVENNREENNREEVLGEIHSRHSALANSVFTRPTGLLYQKAGLKAAILKPEAAKEGAKGQECG